MQGKCEIEANFGATGFLYSHSAWDTFLQEGEYTKSLAAERYLTHITTDKPIYRPGDTMYFRGWLLHAHKHTI
ncbi:hypothetical protein, partial [Vibrio vulnificus]|uniref:hypothetical protein n=1 Tax=Vibrio vulnificus TaxID=672 RepID=UPI0019D4AD27